MDLCELLQPCLNGGNCRNQKDINYICLCINGFEGDNCEIEGKSLILYGILV